MGSKMKRRDKINDIMRLLADDMDKTFDEVRRQTNKLVYEFAEKSGMSIYDVCFTTVPDVKYIEPQHSYCFDDKRYLMESAKNAMTIDITLKPWVYKEDAEFWRDKYLALKEELKKLIEE